MKGTPTVFIAHDAGDAWIARHMAQQIREHGAAVFVDVLDLDHGDDFEQRIVEAARSADELVVLLTPWSLRRPWVWLEIGMFLALEKRIVGVLYRTDAEEVRSDPDVPSTIKRLHLVQLDGFDRYLRQLGSRAHDRDDH